MNVSANFVGTHGQQGQRTQRRVRIVNDTVGMRT